MDGTAHNISTYRALGAEVQPRTGNPKDMKTAFSHPHPDAEYQVVSTLDPPHMVKLIRTALKDHKTIVWKSKVPSYIYIYMLDCNAVTIDYICLTEQLLSSNCNGVTEKM